MSKSRRFARSLNKVPFILFDHEEVEAMFGENLPVPLITQNQPVAGWTLRSMVNVHDDDATYVDVARQTLRDLVDSDDLWAFAVVENAPDRFTIGVFEKV